MSRGDFTLDVLTPCQALLKRSLQHNRAVVRTQLSLLLLLRASLRSSAALVFSSFFGFAGTESFVVCVSGGACKMRSQNKNSRPFHTTGVTGASSMSSL